MFQHEFRKQDLAFRYTVDDTYRDAKVQIVLADMPRIGQVLINLITNAMKFTRLAKGEKRVICSVAASTTRPKSYPPNVVFFESEHTVKRMDATTSKEWGKGEEIYVMVAVKDTGIGISPEGQQRLFERFRQATPKTEEVYGGSGLGLNISRKICHLHGGEIGVSAKEGKGSTFGFFFKVRRAEQYPAGSGDGDATHALQGESRLQDQMKALGMSSPYDLERTEPFEWTPGRKASKLSGEGKYRNDQDAKDREEAAEGEKERDASHHRPRPTPQQLSGGGGGGDKLQSQALQKSDSAMQDARRPSVGLKRNGARAHVLLVEDNVINQKIVFRKLDAKGKPSLSLPPAPTCTHSLANHIPLLPHFPGFNVTTANNGQEAVDAIKAAPPPSSGDKNAIDVILMDKEMPVLDGNAATRAIRQLERDGTVEHVPILGVTANVRGAQQEEMLSCGMDAVLSKPYRIEEMVSRLTALVPDDCLGEESSFTE
jgi:CheY-like chemotaxis protein